MSLNKKTNKKVVVFLALAFVMTLPFQNCIQQGGFSSGSEGSSSSSDLSSSSNSGTVPGAPGTPPVVPAPPPGVVLSPAQKQTLCLSLVGKPTMETITTTDFTFKVGMGSALSGDASSNELTVSGNAGIKDKAQFDANGCASLFNMELSCDVVQNDAARPILLTQALNLDGINVAANADAASRFEIAKKVFKMDDCAQDYNTAMIQASGMNSVKSRIVSNSDEDDGFRCASGSFFIRYTVRNSVGNANQSSNVHFMKVNVQNGCWDESKMLGSGNSQNSQFGSAVAVDGNLAAVVAQTESSGSMTKVGSVSIFEKSGTNWVFRQKIVLPNAVSDDAVQSVALKGSTLFIGSPYRNGTGAVFQYEKNGQDFVFVSQVPRPLTGNATLDNQEQYFGFSLAFNGSQLVVGAPHYSDLSQQRKGQVYVFSVSGGQSIYQQTLIHPDSVSTNKGFGMSVSLSGSYLAVGAPQAVTKEQLGRGDVIVFDQSSGSFVSSRKLTASINNGAKFGYSVAMSGKRLIIGAPGYDKGKPAESSNSGGVYYFADYTTAAPANPQYSGNKDEWVGVSVALNDQGLFFSNPYGNSRAGFVNYYRYSNMQTVSYRLFGLDTANNDAFGWGLAVAGTTVVTGARVKNNPEANAGAAYIHVMK